jgi:hypothetical protein
MAARMAMIAITTRSSMSVKALVVEYFIKFDPGPHELGVGPFDPPLTP